MRAVALVRAAGFALCAAAGGCSLVHRAPDVPPNVRVTEYRGGRWFDGTTFVDRTMYTAGAVFRAHRPSRVDTIVDLAGGYVVPPFGDAHVHFLDPRGMARYAAQFLREGIFYVRNQNGAPMLHRMMMPLANTPTSIDYLDANQGWTSPGGHPVEVIAQGVQMGIIDAAFLRDSLDFGAAMLVDTPEDVDRHWPAFIASTPKPDFVKVFLLVSEEHAQRRQNPRMVGNRGINPALVPLIVERAHAAGLLVSAHVSTAADFRVAVNAGVDQLAHLPGQRGDPAPYLLTESDAASAAAHRVPVITTVAMRGDSALTDRIMRDTYAPNIRVLRAAGVPLLIGSDRFDGGTAVGEIAALARSGLFTNLELLRMWSVNTPRSIYPKRNIGELRDGYEASFVVLRADPLADIRNTRTIALLVKQGVTPP